MKAFSTLLTGILLLSFAGYAQQPKMSNIWFFGQNAGLDFSNGNPVAISNGAMNANEGSVSIADINGNLLFYSNGGERPTTGAIWNRNHQVMLNGALGSNTRGCGSSLQAAIALPQPGKKNIYYMFTTDCRENNLAGGLSYNVIDMNLDGGLGGVVLKSVGLMDYTTESLTAIKHGNGKDYWILVNKAETDSFFAYHFTKDGIVGVVKSKTGGPASTRDAGELKVSANGEKVFFASGNASLLYQFDKNTGVLSNPLDLGIQYGYTGAFSPNCERLYVADFNARKIYQFTVTATNVRSTKVLIATSSGFIGSLQLGPDGKIYVARRNVSFLGVIQNPNLRGTACNYIENGVSLGSAQSKFGLPNFANDVVGECNSYPVENTSDYAYSFYPEHINYNDLTLVWNPFHGATSYKIGVRSVKDDTWTAYYSDVNKISIANLHADTEYEFRIEEVIYPNAIYIPVKGHIFTSDGEASALENAIASIKVKTLNQFNYNVVPNPAKDMAHIHINTGSSIMNVEVKIFDATGKLVLTERYDNVSGYNSLPLSLTGLPKGTYNLTVTSENNTGNKRLVVLN
jgi:hypothetical protein